MPPDQKPPNSHSLWMHRLLHDDVRILWPSNTTILLVHIAIEVKMSFVRKDDFSVKMFIFNQALFSPSGEPKTHRHTASILALIELCTASYRFYSKFFSKKCVKCSSFENDGKLMLMVVQAHSEQQQQCFRLTLLDEHVNELLYPIRTLSNNPVWRIRFTNWSTNYVEGISFLPNFPRKFLTVWVNFLQLKTHYFRSKFSIFPNFVQTYSDPFHKCQTKN